MLTHDAALEIKSLSPSGTFSGYGSVYGVPDQGDDIVAQGCFTESLASWQAKSALPALLWQHKSSEPIGAYTRMSEDPRGLFVEGQLAMKTQRGREAYDLLQMKAISGLSIGFVTRDDSYDQKTGVRTIKRADLWEVSLVTFPMNTSATVDSVKDTVPQFDTPSKFERYLRDVRGATKSEARAIVSELNKMYRRDAGDVDHASAILTAINRGASAMKDAEDGSDPTPETDDSCSLDAGCCMPGECCNLLGKCMAAAIGAMGPKP